MGGYTNGRYPLSMMVKLDEYHYLPPATAKRWLALKAYVYDTWRVTINILPGWNAYRPFANQEYARRMACQRGRCQDAAIPGTSSHGLIYIYVPGTPGDAGKYRARNGHASAAIDVTGYQALRQSDWYAACRKFGFEPGFFYWEPWHIVDWDPWASVPAGSINLEEDMPINDEDIKKLAAAVWTHKSAVNGNRFGDMLRVVYEAVRFGKKGVRTHGELTGALMAEIGAQKIFRAAHGQGEKVDVPALATAIAEQLDPVDAQALANAILRAQGKALTDAADG